MAVINSNRTANWLQPQAIMWLIQRCSDQFVRAWLIQERNTLESLGVPISSSGTQIGIAEIKE